MESEIKQDPEYTQRRYREYKNDSFVNGCISQIQKINAYAKPFIVVNITNPDESVFDIDEESKKAIQYWKNKIDEYVKVEYKDIFRNP